MPTIVTDIVNQMFRSQRNKRAFAKKLSQLPATSESETEDSDAESLDRSMDQSLDVSRDFVQMAANQPQEEYFLWGTELSRSKDVYVLKLDEDINEDEERHLLLLKNFCLGINAVENERNVVEIQTTDFSDKEQRHPVASLTLGKRDFANVDLCLNFSKTKEIKFKLVMGSGPVTISGNHYVEYLALPEEDDDPEFVPEETDDETEISTFEDPEEIDEDELKELAADSEKPVDAAATNGASTAPSTNDGKRKRPASPSEPSTKKRKSDSEDVSVKEVDLKA